MRTIRIFLASSEELNDDRQAFGNLVRKLDRIYEKRGIRIELFEWEDYDAAYNGVRKQDEYNDAIKASDMFLALFHLKAGIYTIEEFEIATEEFKRTGKKPKSYVYCKDINPDEQESEELREFKKRLFEEMGHYWTRYNNGDTMRLHFVMQLQLVEGCQNERIRVENNVVKFADQAIAKVDNLSFISNNEDYKRISGRLLQLPLEVEKVRLKLEKHPDDEDYREDLQSILNEQQKLKEEFDRQNQLLLETAMRITQLQVERISDRVRRAIVAFEQGNVREANIILDEAEKDAELTIQDYKRSKQVTEQKRGAVENSIEELLLKASTIMADSSLLIDDRIEKTHAIYRQADEMASVISFNGEKYELLLFAYANFISSYGSSSLAVSLFKRLYSLSENLRGNNHPNLGIIANSLGIAYEKSGDYQNAISCYQKALLYVLEDDVVSKSTIYNNVGFAYYCIGDFRKAFDYYKSSLDIKERLLGVSNIETAATYNNLGLLFCAQAKYSESLELFLKTLKIRTEIFGEEHPEVAKVCGCIGEAYYYLGEYEKSLDYEFRALTICKKVLGLNHADTASYYNGIGRAYRHMGDTDKALEYYSMAVKISSEVLGENHPDTSTYQNNLGSLYTELGENEKAIMLLCSSLEIRKRVYGQYHPMTANSYSSIGDALRAQGEDVKALECYQTAADIRESLFGKSHPDYANSMNSIGLVYLERREYGQALSYFTQAINICKSSVGEHSPFSAIVYGNLGVVYENLGDIVNAYESYHNSLIITEGLFGKNHPRTANLYYILGGILYNAGEYTYAIEYANNALTIWSLLLGKDSVKVAECYEALAEIILALNNPSNALELFDKALDILLLHYDEDSSRVQYIKSRISEVRDNY